VTQTALINARVLAPAGLRDDLVVVIEDDRIRSVSEHVPSGAAIHDLAGSLLLPGFIDIQVNGGGGRLFNDDPSVETIACIAAAHRRFGTTGLLPTLISDDFAVVERGMRAVDQAIEQGVPGVLGIHVEGPFLSAARHGIHLAEKLQPLSDEFLDLLTADRRGRTLVTLAPECARPEQIARLAKAGVRVSLGHSDARYEEARAALDAGASGFTHLFNAMSQLANRAPGMVGAALESETAFAGIIVDGQHLHPATVRIALRAMGAERLMLISDAMPTVGADIDSFNLQGRTIRLDGDRLADEHGTLAGSVLTMASAVRTLMAQTGSSLARSVAMATRVPATFLGIDREVGTIAPGLRADLIAVDPQLDLRRCWIGGTEIRPE
jgi:N-acetylglucosamine-6-phosphate deacetylase